MSYSITTTVDIDAGTDAVWDVLIDFPRYGEWSNVRSAEGAPRVGSRLTMRMPGFSFRPTVTVVTPGEQLQWTGALVTERLFHGRHSFILRARPDGTTQLTNLEEFSGALTAVLQRFTKRNGDNGYATFNASLKRQVESRTA